jgi:hypothetical protein
MEMVLTPLSMLIILGLLGRLALILLIIMMIVALKVMFVPIRILFLSHRGRVAGALAAATLELCLPD